MTTTHTPGPWNVQSHDIQQRIKAGAATIALPCMNDYVSALQCSANARLIAAAPALLAALQAVADYWAGGDVPAEIDAQMRAVIASATGADQ